MTSKASSASPPWAMKVWVDFNHLYLEMAGTNGIPYVEKHPLTGDGLLKALSLLKAIHAEVAPPSGYTTVQFPITKASPIANFSASQRASARAALRKLGIGT